MTWKNGRQLATLQDSDDTISYEYDSNSVRIKKTVDGVEHTYAYLGGKLMYETRGEAKFYYSYDANGYLYNVKYTLTDDSERKSYFFTHNSFGDIIGIYSGSGVLTAQYEYDAWGKVISITDGNGNEITDTNNIGLLNPFRYRGYYYDSETGLYYLMSRYYDPVTRRFINADGYFQSGGSILDGNMSAYCRNNPITFIDPYGETVYTFGVSGFISAIAGFSGSIYYACDDKGNSGIYFSYIDYDKSMGVGELSASVGITGSILWDVDTIDNLNNNSISVGFSNGTGYSRGIDFIFFEGEDALGGISGTAGLGGGMDLVHMYSATTTEIWRSNSKSNTLKSVTSHGGGGVAISKSSSKQQTKKSTTPIKITSTYKICTGCGRPKGNQYTWQCKSPSYF